MKLGDIITEKLMDEAYGQANEINQLADQIVSYFAVRNVSIAHNWSSFFNLSFDNMIGRLGAIAKSGQFEELSDFINNRPSIKMIALGFLVMIGVVLIGEAFELEINKNYIYIAMIFALVVEFMNIKMRKNHRNYTPKH